MPVRRASLFVAEGQVIVPLVQNFVQSDKLEFDWRLKAEWIRERPWDGWFHSSSHPSQSTEQLLDYLQQRSQREAMTYVGRMSTLFGSLVHVVVQGALDQHGVTVPLPPGRCDVCGLARVGKNTCREHGAIDVETHSRGHMDAIVTIGPGGLNILDIKTIKPWGGYGLKDAIDMDLEFFKAKWPKYYAQLQDYMRMTGIRNSICFFMSTGPPWEMREYHIPFDPVFAFTIETRYKRALEMAAAQ